MPLRGGWTTIRKTSQKQEATSARILGGKTVRASGAMWHRKGDFKTEAHLGECKYTGKAQITLPKAWLDKICKEALKNGLKPVLLLNFDGSTSPEYAVIPFQDFKEAFYE